MFKDRAELFIAVGNWMKACAEQGVEAEIKYEMHPLKCEYAQLSENPSDYSLPYLIIEGKSVWEGSNLFLPCGKEIAASEETLHLLPSCSWEKPKPKTVIVKMLIDDVDYFAANYTGSLGDACRAALEKQI